MNTTCTVTEILESQRVTRNLPDISSNSCRSRRAIQIIDRYGDKISFLKLFTPDKQPVYCKAEQRCIEGSSPTLDGIGEAFGYDASLSWLEIQIKDLSDFSGCRDKLDINQIKEISRLMISEYGWIKATEIMLFLYRFKLGKYGKFYGAVDGLVITTAFNEFLDYIFEKKQEYDEVRRKQKNIEQSEWDKYHVMTRNEYLEIGWLFNIGYEPEYFTSPQDFDEIERNINNYKKTMQ